MKYHVVYLRAHNSCKITDFIVDDFWFEEINHCQLTLITYDGLYCQNSMNLIPKIKYSKPNSYELTVQLLRPIASIIMKQITLVFFVIPAFLLTGGQSSLMTPQNEKQRPPITSISKASVDYHHWKWGHPHPSWILLPNLNNDPQYYFPLTFKKLLSLTTQQAIN